MSEETNTEEAIEIIINAEEIGKEAGKIVAREIRKLKMQENETAITDVNMRFMSMVWFMIKWTFATIPAFILGSLILLLIATVCPILLTGLMTLLLSGFAG